jgi:hypothetical protein
MNYTYFYSRPHKVIMFILSIFIVSCINLNTSVPKPQSNGPFVVKGHLIHGTTGKPYNIGEQISLTISWTDWNTVSHNEILGSATIQKDGSFELKYPYHNQSLSLTSTLELRSNAFSTFKLPRNENIIDTFYYTTQASVRLFADLSARLPLDTVFIAIYSTTQKHPIFDTLTSRFNGFVGEYRMPIMNNKTSLSYGLNYSIADKYDSIAMRYRGTDLHNLKSHTIYPNGDPWVDSTYLVIK